MGDLGDGKTAFIEMAAASGLELVPAGKTRSTRDHFTRHGRVCHLFQALESGADEAFYRHWR
ncbi:glycerate kinase [Shigella flexneri]